MFRTEQCVTVSIQVSDRKPQKILSSGKTKDWRYKTKMVDARSKLILRSDRPVPPNDAVLAADVLGRLFKKKNQKILAAHYQPRDVQACS